MKDRPAVPAAAAFIKSLRVIPRLLPEKESDIPLTSCYFWIVGCFFNGARSGEKHIFLRYTSQQIAVKEVDPLAPSHLVPAIVFKDMIILGGLAIFFKNRAIKGVVDFEERKMLEVFGYAFNRQGFFVEGLTPYFMAPAGNAFFVSPLRINLPDPPGIPVTGRSN